MKSIKFISAIAVVALTQPIEVKAEISTPKTFGNWCVQKESVSRESKKTIEAVLAEVGTKNCQVADLKTEKLENLDLNNKQIRDLRPIASLVNLKKLNIANNSIVDLSPLKSLVKLEQLSAQANEIKNLYPLSGLTSIKKLRLEKNQISDVSALGDISSLEELTLVGNKIDDFTSLGKLNSLYLLEFEKSSVRPQAIKEFENLMLKIDLISALNNTDLEKPSTSNITWQPNNLTENLIRKFTEFQGSYSAPTVGSVTGGFTGMLLTMFIGLRWFINTNIVKRKKKSSKIFGQALDIFPGLEEDWLILSKALNKVGFYEEAAEVLDKLVIINPDSAEIWRARGDVLTNIPKTDDAIKSYQMALIIEGLRCNEGLEPENKIDSVIVDEVDIKCPF
jgi:Leucine-rich repeat (LRR) protein